MSSHDFSTIRWDRMRWDLVNAMAKAAEYHPGANHLFCTNIECCLDLNKQLPNFGLTYRSDSDAGPDFSHRDDLESWVTGAMRDGITMVSTFIRFGLDHPLTGAMEVPMEVGEIINSPYFANWRSDEGIHVSDEPAAEVRELLYAFVRLAFPDEYLARVHEDTAKQHLGHDEPQRVSGWDANAHLAQRFESEGLVAPLLSTGMIESLQMDIASGATGTEHFWNFSWRFGAGYDLGMGMEEASLRDYWEGLQSIPDVFEYSESRNGVSRIMGFVARSLGLFVSQQVYNADDPASWNVCTSSFNKHLAPLLEKPNPFGTAMVVFSYYRRDAYIVSDVEESWDEYAPASAVLGPLPNGWGIVGVWNNYDDGRYTPRPLEDVIRADWSDQITASARYLSDCIDTCR